MNTVDDGVGGPRRECQDVATVDDGHFESSLGNVQHRSIARKRSRETTYRRIVGSQRAPYKVRWELRICTEKGGDERRLFCCCCHELHPDLTS